LRHKHTRLPRLLSLKIIDHSTGSVRYKPQLHLPLDFFATRQSKVCIKSTSTGRLMAHFSKAFDVVSYDILTNKFTALQLSPFVFNWIILFLRTRTVINCQLNVELPDVFRVLG